MRRPTRYRSSARFYDLISAEWPIYRVGRIAAIDLLGLQQDESVLDIGCGTGLNFPHLQRRIGPGGSITGVDASPQMLRQAQLRAAAAGWDNVRLIEADATMLDSDSPHFDADFDAAISTYALSLMPNWRRAVSVMIDATRLGGRVAVVDMQKPVGKSQVWTPLAKLACTLGGSDIDAHPWTVTESSLADVSEVSFWGGHVQVRVGSVRE